MINKLCKLALTITFMVMCVFSFNVQASDKISPDGDPQQYRAMQAEEEYKNYKNNIMNFAQYSSLSTSITSPYSGVTYTNNSQFDGIDIVNGIDVSYYQGEINWNKVKKDGIEFVIIRVGYRTYGTGTIYLDDKFKEYMEGATNAGLKVGVYIFSQAITKAEAVEEAKYCISHVSGYDLALPIVIDYEYAGNGTAGRLYNAGLSIGEKTNICNAFCDYVEANGYMGMVYANKSMLEDDLNATNIANSHYIWIARYNYKTGYSGKYQFWQYSSVGSVSGISGAVDCNFWYDDGTLTSKKIASTSATLSSTSQNLTVGDTVKLKATLLPEDTTDTYRWTSSNPAVAYITTAGKVVAVSKGSTTITMTTSSGIKATCKVKVFEKLSNYRISKIDNYVYTGKEIEPEVTVQSKSKVVTKAKATTTVNLRCGPSKSYSVITTVPIKSKVKVLGSVTTGSGIWYAVKYTSNGVSYRGYCKASYFKVITDEKKTLSKDDYTVKYLNNKSVGLATVKVTANESSQYNGSCKRTFEITPKKVKNLSVVKYSSSYIKLSYNKVSKATGYMIYRASAIDGKYSKIATIKDADILTYKDTSVKEGTEYYYKVKAYTKIDGVKYYGEYSKILTANTKYTTKVRAVTKTAVNVRKYAGKKYRKKTTLLSGTTVKVIAQTKDKYGNKWLKVAYKNNKGVEKTGYIIKKYLKIK